MTAAPAVSLQQPATSRGAAVPETVQKMLANAGCHRPQANQQHTITRGHFVRPSQDDWAALCVSGQSSFVYVVWGGTAQCPSILASRRNKDFETSDGGFQRVLRTRGSDSMLALLRASEKPAQTKIDHDGIEDANDGAASTVHYCLNRSWVSLSGTD